MFGHIASGRAIGRGELVIAYEFTCIIAPQPYAECANIGLGDPKNVS